jgi:hypothetical protein
MSDRPQISLKTFLISTSFIGAGIGCYVGGYVALTGYEESWWRGVLQLVEILAAGPLLGVGLFLPFRHPRLGAYAGFFAPIASVIGYFFFDAGWREGWIVASQGPDRPIFMPVIVLTTFVILLGAFSAIRGLLRRRMNDDVSRQANDPRLC